ncbi:MAG: addiction module protein [Candidatus Marinimicrobia bacterium]|nr:addiction module protein [Candidatus Neomarinimicrobiota bacterium]
MTAQAQQILNDAVHLSPMERAELVEKILASFNFSNRNDIDASWAIEVENRIDAYDQGKIKLRTADEVFDKINK